MREVSVSNRQRAVPVNAARLQEMGQWLLGRCREWGEGDLGVRLVGCREMAVLNQRHLGHEGSTDVITFDYAATGLPRESSEGSGLRGELVICPEVARRQAASFGTRWEAELARYLIHGILHLLGYDDLESVARRRMKQAEDRWLRALRREFELAVLAGKG